MVLFFDAPIKHMQIIRSLVVDKELVVGTVYKRDQLCIVSCAFVSYCSREKEWNTKRWLHSCYYLDYDSYLMVTTKLNRSS